MKRGPPVAKVFMHKSRAFSRMHSHGSSNAGRSVSYLELIAWVLFGASGWFSSNAITSEQALFIDVLPASRKIGSQLAMMTQCGNIFLFLYQVLKQYRDLDVGSVIHVMMAVGLVALLVSAIYWDSLVGDECVPLLAMAFLAGGVGCMSMSTYWAYIISYPAACTKAVGVGMSAGGVITTHLVLLQVGNSESGTPNFSVSAFFALTASMQVLLWIVMLMHQGGLRSRCHSGMGLPTWSEPLLEKDIGIMDYHAHKGEISEGTADGAVYTTNGSTLECAEYAEILNTSSDDSTEEFALLDQRWISFLYVCSFATLAGTYSLPSVMPFVASAFPKVQRQMMARLLASAQWGETIGRLLAPVGNSESCLPWLALVFLIIGFVLLLMIAACPSLARRLVWEGAAITVVPLVSLAYYVSYGTVQTMLICWVSKWVGDQRIAEKVASNIGFAGQLGALSSNLFAFFYVNY